MALDLTPEERDAVLALLAEAPLEVDDLVVALQRSMQVRRENSRHGSLVIQALRRYMSLRDLSERTGIPKSTLETWGTPPKGSRP